MLIIELPITMIRCLVCTIVIELLVALLIGIRNHKDLLNILLVNIVTNPLVVIFPIIFEFQYSYSARIIALFVFEVLAFLFEGIIYMKYFKYKKINGFLVSFVLNLSSYLICELINYILY